MTDDKKKFDEFYDWAQILLNDFSDVDLGCVDSSKYLEVSLEVKQLKVGLMKSGVSTMII